MLQFGKFERPATVEEALALLQKNKANRILGGGVWLRLQDRRIPCVIDLSACGLDRIELDDDRGAWRIGAMVTLHQLECHEDFNASTCGVFEAAVCDIVGVQMRNLATVGGSLYGRFGFSDILTALLPLGCEVELAGAGTVPLAEFATAKAYERDILTHLVVPAHADLTAAFICVRRQSTDFSVLNVAAARVGGAWSVAVGARPARAVLVGSDALGLPATFGAGATPARVAEDGSVVPAILSDEDAAALEGALDAFAALTFGDNMRASKRYRRHLARELGRRAILEAAGLAAPIAPAEPAFRAAAGEDHASAAAEARDGLGGSTLGFSANAALDAAKEADAC